MNKHVGVLVEAAGCISSRSNSWRVAIGTISEFLRTILHRQAPTSTGSQRAMWIRIYRKGFLLGAGVLGVAMLDGWSVSIPPCEVLRACVPLSSPGHTQSAGLDRRNADGAIAGTPLELRSRVLRHMKYHGF